MLDAVRVFLEDVGHHIRIADVFDIGLVSVFLFIVLVWLRQSTAGSARRRAFVVALAFLGVYLMARFLELYLVEQLTQVMFIVFLIAAVIVFQSDIRRMLDRVGTWSFSGPGKAEPYGPIVDLLAQASARLADTKTGARRWRSASIRSPVPRITHS
jgi:DNA integrity scanning protein DisA with diadenylate cyclase activity